MAQHEIHDPPGAEGHGPDDQLPRDAPTEMPLPPLPRPPFWMIAIGLISVVASWLPFAVIARARVTRSDETRIQLMQDMGSQPRFSEQQTNPLFADDRANRPKIPGTVSQNIDADLDNDDHFYHGFVRVVDPVSGKQDVKYFEDFPGQSPVEPKLLERGKNRFAIYCYVCHGYDGQGHGPVNERAMQDQSDAGMNGDPRLAGMTWTQAANLTSDIIRAEPVGKIFNTITNGIRAMPSYGAQIPVEDRWAIVSYVRALQLSQHAPPSLVDNVGSIATEPPPPTTQPATVPASAPAVSPATK